MVHIAAPMFRPLRLLRLTAQGRFIAVGLMLVGIALVGSLTAVIAAWLVENVQHADQQDDWKSHPDLAMSA